MISDSYRDYVEQLIKTNRGEYPYYVAHTCTYWSVTNSSALPSIKVYLSKEPITATSLYSYVCPSNTLVYNIVGANGSSNYHNARVTTTTFSGSLNIDSYEFVYSNAEAKTNSITLQPDLLASTNVQQSHFDSAVLILLVVLLASVVVKLIRR